MSKETEKQAGKLGEETNAPDMDAAQDTQEIPNEELDQVAGGSYTKVPISVEKITFGKC
ncbi:MAG: hypothetical protein LIP10_01795 [Clostridiales bacterium]|nr:hypothetical protein [Clostridiales bacterium]